MNSLVGVKFDNSEIKKAIDPDSSVSQYIDKFEKELFEANIVDEAKQEMSGSFYQMIYRKDGKEIVTLYPAKNDCSLKLASGNWDISIFSSMPVQLEYLKEEMCWKINSVTKIKISGLIEVIKKSQKYKHDLYLSLIHTYTVMKAFVLKNSILFNDKDKLAELAVNHFWSGEFEEIEILYKKLTSNKYEFLKTFFENWDKELKYEKQIPIRLFTPSMESDLHQLKELFSKLNVSLDTASEQYISSIKSIWFNNELMDDFQKFHQTTEIIRRNMNRTRQFSIDLKAVIEQINEDEEKEEFYSSVIKQAENLKEEAVEIVEKEQLVEKSVEKPSIDEQLLHFSPSKSASLLSTYDLKSEHIPFIDREETLQYMYAELHLNNEAIRKLASQLTGDEKYYPELITLITELVEACNTNGYVIKEELKQSFMEKYHDTKAILEYCERYHVQRLAVQSSLENTFEKVMNDFYNFNLIKITTKQIQGDDEQLIYWNYNVCVYE